MEIDSQALTTCDVSQDGGAISLSFADTIGSPATIRLPLDQAGALLMTLPGLIDRALQTRFGDQSLRYAYPLASWVIEQSSNATQCIVTLRTADGFSVCFSIPLQRQIELGEALAAQLAPKMEEADMTQHGQLASSHPISSIDPFSPEFLADPYPFHHELREAGAVVWLERYSTWTVARYDDVHRTLNDWQTFCSNRGVGMSDFAKEKPWRPPSLVLEKDPPDHDRTRSVLNKVLSPAVMKTLRERFARAAEAKADELIEIGEFDAIVELAQGFPLSVFPDAVGMRKDGREHLLPYAGAVFNAFGPDNDLRRNAIERAAPHISWIAEQCQRQNLALDGLGAKIFAAADAGEIAMEEAPVLVRSLLSAGLDTTVNGFGAAIFCLGRFPDQWAKLHANPSLARAAFEEGIRFESPVQTFFRTTTKPVSLGGVQMDEGSKILMLLASANRDPRKWENPDSYDIERRTSGHVGFGSGIHMCVGQLLARLEGEVMLSALASKVRSIEITGEPKRAFNNTLRGLESLPVAIKAK